MFLCLDCSRKSKKKLAELDDYAEPFAAENVANAGSPIEDENNASLSNNVAEPDDWSDTPLSALKNEPADDDLKSSIDATIQAVSESEYKFDESAASSAVKDDDTVTGEPKETSTSTKTEKGSDAAAAEDDTTSSPAKSTPQSSKTKRRSKTPRSKNSK
jgi:hypothetical protein